MLSYSFDFVNCKHHFDNEISFWRCYYFIGDYMIANKIKILRENKGLSQKALADKLGITRSSVNAWEQGISVPSTQYIVELATLFEVSTDYLLNFKNDKAISIEGLNDKEVKIVLELIEYFKQK